MKRVIKTVGALSLVGCAIVNAPFAAAADDNGNGWYGGLGIGQSRAKIDDARISSGLLGSGFTTTSISHDDRDLGYKIFGGLKLNKNFALEAGYFNLGELGFTATTTPTGTLSGNAKVSGLNFDALGILPFTPKFSAFGRVGVQYAQAKDSFSGSGGINVSDSGPSKRAANYKVGLGVQYDVTQRVGFRGEWERYRINDAVGNRGDIDLLSVGLVYKFGGAKSTPAHAATPPPTHVAAAPTPTPVPVAPKSEQYCSILDIQFDINGDEIQREEKERLGVVGTFLKKYPDTTAVIEGHTDNVGNNADNLKLSQRRAESVVAYLVETFHIDPSRLKAVGYGEMNPLSSNRTEAGKRANRRINAVISCAKDIEGLTVVPARITMAMEMEFDRNKADVKPQYRDDLQKVAKFLKANPAVTATVEGHTGNVQGVSPAQEQEISQRRAQNVVDYLVNNFGVTRSHLTAEGFGQTRRAAYGKSKEGQQENRRVKIIINYAKK